MGGKLGGDLEMEILVRLPAKSLMRFKCVQRSWNVLFKTPTFVARHKHVHVSNERHLMIFDKNVLNNPDIKLFHCDDLTATCTPIKSLFPHIDNNSPVTGITSYGHCNGIFCLHDIIRDQLILWNPTTREVYAIPPPPLPYHPYLLDSQLILVPLFGFGAADHPNNNTNHLKVVNLHVDIDMKSHSMAQIYSINTKSWEIIHGPILSCRTPVLRNRTKYNTLVNGVYHWITGSCGDDVENILCFDFRNNRLSKLRAPISTLLTDWEDIAEINGSLAYVAEYHESRSHREVRLIIWVMSEQGWAKKYSIGPIGPGVRIRGIWKDGAQVLGGKVGELLMSYDHDGNLVGQFQITVPYHDFELSVYEYVPSIAPLST